MWGNITQLAYEHLHQPVRCPYERWMNQVTGKVQRGQGPNRWGYRGQEAKGTCHVPPPLSQREWRARDSRQGEEDRATSQEAELETDANGEKHGLNLLGNAISEEGLTQSPRHSLAVTSKRAAAQFDHPSDFIATSVTLLS